MQISYQENAEHLAQLGDVDIETAKRLLQKFKGDMEKAVDALLSGDKGYDNAWEAQHRTTPDPAYTDGRSTAVAPHPSSSVIDLTTDHDDEYNRAIQMSMQDSQASTTTQTDFKPTDRPADPAWQVVLANQPVEGPSVQDRNLDEAIQASLQEFNKDEDASAVPDVSSRQGGRPIALRPKAANHAYATLVLQALYHVPQIRAAVSTLQLPDLAEDTALSHQDRALWNIIELFTNLDLAQLAFIYDTSLIPSLNAPILDSPKYLADFSGDVVKAINSLIEEALQDQTAEGEDPDCLLTFTHGSVYVSPQSDPPLRLFRQPTDGQVVVVKYGTDPQYNDLVSCMEHILSGVNDEGEYHDVIIRPSDIIVFQLQRQPTIGPMRPSQDPFMFPKAFYLDRFLFSNVLDVCERRLVEKRAKEEIHELQKQRETLTHHNKGRDTLADLRSTLYYYENVAQRGDEDRNRTLQRSIQCLQDLLTMINAKIEDIDHRVGKLQTEVAALYDVPELKQWRYDLRSVLMHTGLPGRKQMYSYVQDIEGTWWKTVDYEVTDVPEETVLTDPTGIHLSAGPYMLIYSRQLSEEQLREPLIWPSVLSTAVEMNNAKFLAAMYPELNVFQSTPSPEGSGPENVQRPAPLPPSGNAGQGRSDREGSWSMSVD